MSPSSQDRSEMSGPRIAEVFDGKSVFVTGAAGFVGAVLLESLLRCCPGIKTVYILLRSKKDVPPENRKGQIFQKKIFDQLKSENPKSFEKVRVMPGDISKPHLGMDQEDIEEIIEEVSFVFHCAAIISFIKPLRYILSHNTVGLNSVVELCKKLKQLDALVYTSTAYSNSNHLKTLMREHIYPLPFPAQDFLDAVEKEDDDRLQELVNECKPDWPNWYTFSKCLAENVIREKASDLPVAIIRPSIVASTWKKPIAGYVEGGSGLTGISTARTYLAMLFVSPSQVGKGFVRVIRCNDKCRLNFAPVDSVANAHLAAAWAVCTKRMPSPLVMNCASRTNDHLDVKMPKLVHDLCNLGATHPMPKAFSKFAVPACVSNDYYYQVLSLYEHYIPAYVIDFMLKVMGKKPRLAYMYRFFDTMMSCLHYFTSNEFNFERDNLENIDKMLHPDDSELLVLNWSEVTFEEYAQAIPKVASFYQWDTDQKSFKERQNVINQRYMIITTIKVGFLLLCFLVIYWFLMMICC
ncbi:putative fatty acyl-CoA reductase CG5065 [Caerostris darwini]|uniref:Fatty acyl-CoA reductase n=1 Tax=Caerostris darwini TaxID=1538125 RepID=A0AAV4NCA4_9ARAC|nr:putative fatty acyl-CoA reductase CG5065 [Caerostris darwini]